MEVVLKQWPNVKPEAYRSVDCTVDRFWVRCLGRVVAGLTRRSEWAAARAVGGDKWIMRVATRRARFYGSIDNAPQWLKQLETLGRSPYATRYRGEVQRAITRFLLLQRAPAHMPRFFALQTRHQTLVQN